MGAFFFAQRFDALIQFVQCRCRSSNFGIEGVKFAIGLSARGNILVNLDGEAIALSRIQPPD